MREEDRVPTSPIKPRPRPGKQWLFSACRERGGGRGPERGRGPKGGLEDCLPTPQPLSRPGPGRSRVPSPAPSAGPTETRRARGVETPPAGAPGREGGPRRSGKRGKGRNSRNKPLGENQTNRVRAGRAQSPGRGGVWGPGSWGRALRRERALRLGGSGLGWGGGVGREPQGPCAPAPRGSS